MAGFPLGDAISAVGGIFSQAAANRQSMSLAKKGIQLRVADAKKAGIHPLAALGANIQPVASQPVLGDAALGGLKGLGDAVSGNNDLARKEVESRIRHNDAQTMLTIAQSRTIAQQARQPSGAVTGSSNDVPPRVVSGGVDTYRDPARWSSAQRVQDEFGDLVESIHGAGSLVDSHLSRMGHRFGIQPFVNPSSLSAYIQGEYRRYREWGGRLPANEWMRLRGFEGR